jgi:rod shape-determining protein MreD
MYSELISRIVWFVVLCVVQALVLNHIHLFGFAMPLLYVYFVMLFRRNTPRWVILLWSFLLGLFIDTFSNTPGVAAASATALAAVQPFLLNLFLPRDSAEDLKPGMNTLGVASFVYYTLACVFFYCVLFFSLEAFNFFNWLLWLECIGGSTVLTVVLIIVIEIVRGGKGE